MAESSQGRYRLNRPPGYTYGHIANVAAASHPPHSPNTQPASLSRQTSNIDISRQNSYMDISRQTSFMDSDSIASPTEFEPPLHDPRFTTASVFEDDGDLGSFDDFDPFANDMNDNEESDGSDEPDRPSDNDSDDNESENVDGNPTYPFKNEYMMTVLLYFKANSVKYSEDQIKSILDFTKNMCEIAVSEYQAQIRLDPSNTEYDFKGFPTPHCITKFHKAKTSRIPQFPSANYYVKDSNGVPYDRFDLTINHVSSHIALLLSNPMMSGYLSDLPDLTPNQNIKLSQGEKWTKEKLFEHPMLVITGSDNRLRQLWVSDRVSLISENYLAPDIRSWYKIAKFYQKSNVKMVDLYEILKPEIGDVPNRTYLADIVTSCPVEELNYVDIVRPDGNGEYVLQYISMKRRNDGFEYYSQADFVAGTTVILAHFDMVNTGNRSKHPLPANSKFDVNATPKNYQIYRSIPYNIFSDDTSGNLTKKWNCYDTWSMNPDAVPLSVANHYLNQLFLCGTNKLTAMEQLPYLVDDLVALENADNPRHADVTCMKASAAAYPCRKCFWCRHSNSFAGRITPEDYMSTARLRVHWEALFTDSDLSASDFSILVNNRQGEPIIVDDLESFGFKESTAKLFLRLGSWNPPKDTPVEILHGLCLGLIKYSFSKACECFFNASQVKVINDLCSRYGSKAFSNLKNLQNHKSYLGRDFKLMTQMLPIVLRQAQTHPDFANLVNDSHNRMNNTVPALYKASGYGIINTFDCLGELCSLCYTSEIHTNFDKFTVLLRDASHRTIIALDDLDHTTIPIVRRLRGRGGLAAGPAPIPLAQGETIMTFGEAVSRELEDLVDEVNVEAGSAATTTPHARNGGPLCNRLKTHLIIHLVEDCIRFASPVLLATEKNEQFNKNLRAIIMKTNKQNPSRDLAVINSREVTLRNIAMGCFWDNGVVNEHIIFSYNYHMLSTSFYFSIQQVYLL
ncbi:hypothetical protein BD770DRAFT_475570 [Pilaira anomala]|nr:hypothetical protein BD770DRAFT_475570 [Pilaira anomala]